MSFPRWAHCAMALAITVVPADLRAQAAPGNDIYLVRMSRQAGELTFDRPINITDRDGYDNQPSFHPDGNSILYTSNRGGQTDIYRYYLRTRAARPVIETSPESEYSPTVTPDGEGLTVVRVEADSTQRLWKFTLDGTGPRLVLTDVRPVGYYAWGNEHTVALFVLPDSLPATLRIADTRSGEATIVAYNVGRSIHKVPGRNAVSFTHRVPHHVIKELDLETGTVRPVTALVESSQDYVWTPTGEILSGAGAKLFMWDPAAGAGWKEVADFSAAGVEGISRLAVSARGDWLAFVGERPDGP